MQPALDDGCLELAGSNRPFGFPAHAQELSFLAQLDLVRLEADLVTDAGTFPFAGGDPRGLTTEYALVELRGQPAGIRGLNPGQHPFHFINFALIVPLSLLRSVCFFKSNRLTITSGLAGRSASSVARPVTEGIVIHFPVIDGLFVDYSQFFEDLVVGTCNGQAIDADLVSIRLRPDLQRRPPHLAYRGLYAPHLIH